MLTTVVDGGGTSSDDAFPPKLQPATKIAMNMAPPEYETRLVIRCRLMLPHPLPG
ncbi:MAG: hypothetical protein MUQ27_12945 [Acidimicrobiia bacterium]|nr:hypothetical protein [Acidimicrobiia bacterium]